MSESVAITTLQRERIKRQLAGLRTALATADRRLRELEETLAGLQTMHTMTGSIQGLEGTITVANYEGGWAHIGDGVMVLEREGGSPEGELPY